MTLTGVGSSYKESYLNTSMWNVDKNLFDLIGESSEFSRWISVLEAYGKKWGFWLDCMDGFPVACLSSQGNTHMELLNLV